MNPKVAKVLVLLAVTTSLNLASAIANSGGQTYTPGNDSTP